MPSQEQSLKTASEHEPDSLPARPDCLPARPDSLPTRPDCLPTRPDCLPVRIVTAVGILLICLPLLLAGAVTSFLLALGISNLAAAEWGAMIARSQPAKIRAQITACALVITNLHLLAFAGMQASFSSAALLWSVPLVSGALWAVCCRRLLQHQRLLAWGGLLVILTATSGFWILRIQEQGLLLLLIIIASTACSDSAAYLCGRWLKGPKLAPKISPNKTWSGLIAGLAAANACFLLLWSLFIASPLVYALPMAVALSLCAQGGDFLESWAKRRFQVKDSGRLLPGHGGILDRLDSSGHVLAAVAVIYMLMALIP